MNARERMLGRLRAAAPAQVSGDDLKRLDDSIDLHYDNRRVALPTQTLVESMQAALTASHAEVFRTTEHTWPALIAQRLQQANIKRLLLDTSRAEGAALQQALPPDVATRNYDQPIEHWKAELFDTIDAGFTVARSGLAATGTLIVAPDSGSPRTMSLVPPLHMYRQLRGTYGVSRLGAIWRTFALTIFAFVAIAFFATLLVTLGALD